MLEKRNFVGVTSSISVPRSRQVRDVSFVFSREACSSRRESRKWGVGVCQQLPERDRAVEAVLEGLWRQLAWSIATHVPRAAVYRLSVPSRLPRPWAPPEVEPVGALEPCQGR